MAIRSSGYQKSCQTGDEKSKKNKNDGYDGNVVATEDVSVLEDEISNLVPDPSLPLPQRPNTRDKCKESPNIDRNPNLITNENSFVLSPSEWKAAFSRTQKKMNDGWTKIMYNKLIGKVTLRTTFHSELQVKGKMQDVWNGDTGIRKRWCEV